MKQHPEFILCSILSFFLFGCGGSQTKDVQPVQSSAQKNNEPEITIDQEYGLHATVDQGEIDMVFNKNMETLRACYEKALEDLEDIEGKVILDIEIGDGDKVQKVHIKESDMGSLETEYCLQDRIMGLSLQRQGTGIAYITKELTFEAPYDLPAPKSFDQKAIDKVVSQNQADVERCIGSVNGIHLTLYVGKGGVVWSAGVAVDDYEQQETGRCLAKAARKWKFPDPGVDPAKIFISF